MLKSGDTVGSAAIESAGGGAAQVLVKGVPPFGDQILWMRSDPVAQQDMVGFGDHVLQSRPQEDVAGSHRALKYMVLGATNHMLLGVIDHMLLGATNHMVLGAIDHTLLGAIDRSTACWRRGGGAQRPAQTARRRAHQSLPRPQTRRSSAQTL